jgi:glycosyltransferase involved in cell wall biosynthesis
MSPRRGQLSAHPSRFHRPGPGEYGAERARIRIATVYQPLALSDRNICSMNTVRWLRISEGLAAAGFQVDMIVGPGTDLKPTHRNMRLVAQSKVDWGRYDVIKTEYQRGFQELVAAGGGCHPFIISRLASVVGSRDDVPGVYFFGADRDERYVVLHEIRRAARYISLTTERNRQLWQRELLTDPGRLLLVPGGVDRTIPPPRRNPYEGLTGTGPIAVYIGNLGRIGQPNLVGWWQERLNRIGRLLRKRGMRLVLVGPGPADSLDPDALINVGPVPYQDIWDYQYFADVSLVLAEGPVQVNESSKIYYYLRTGLPIISEAPVPNSDVITMARCGFIVPYDDDHSFAEMVELAVHHPWDRQAAIDYVLAHHTWDHRVATYVDLILRALHGSARRPG